MITQGSSGRSAGRDVGVENVGSAGSLDFHLSVFTANILFYVTLFTEDVENPGQLSL